MASKSINCHIDGDNKTMVEFKVLLVYPNLQMVNLLPSNIAILSACLKNAGINVELFDTTPYKTAEKSVDEIRVEHMQLRPFKLEDKGVTYKITDVFEDFKKTVDKYQPNLIGVSATDDTFDLGIALVEKVRKKQKAHVIVGGVYPTFAPEEAINNKNVDSICIGEGEEALLELCKKLQSNQDIKNIKNLWVKIDGKIYKNNLREPLDINKLPYDDFSIFEEKRLFRPMQGKIYRMIPICIDRGCPFSCTFCAAPCQRELYLGAGHKYFRVKTLQGVMDELRFQIDKYNANYIYFNSETFFAKREEYLDKFARAYTKEIGLPFWCQTRVETISEKRIKMLEQMNCDRISIGIEHGNEEFRKKILKKRFTNKQVIDAFQILRKSRIPVTVNNIIGFPDETRELAFDTIRLNRKIYADSINAYFFVPYRGTPLRQYCIDKGYLDPKSKTDSLMRSSILNMPQFPPDQIKGLVRTFPLYVKMEESYFDKIKIAERLDQEGNAMLADLRDIFFNKYFS